MHAATAPKGETLSELILLLFLALSLPSLESPEIGHSHRKKKKKNTRARTRMRKAKTQPKGLFTQTLFMIPRCYLALA